MLGIIGGAGIGEALLGQPFAEEHVLDTPFGTPSSHVRILRSGASRVAVLARQGEASTIPPSRVPHRANLYALKQIGVTHLLSLDAVRSMRDDVRPKDLVVADQVIDRTTRRAPTFFDEGIAVHVEMAKPYCESLRARFLSNAGLGAARVHPRGTFVCIEGPSWSTAAEANVHRMLGGDIVGMSAMPEARLAREAEMCTAMLAFVVADCEGWRAATLVDASQVPRAQIALDRKAAVEAAMKLLRATLDDLTAHPPSSCECSEALSRAIDTAPSAVGHDVRARYGPLLARFLAD